MNLALILVVLSAITGVVYLLDLLIWSKKRTKDEPPAKLIEFSRSFFPVFFLVLLLRSFLFEPFRIPSGSLEPTLLIGDFIVVNKFAYGVRLPVSEKKIFKVSEPKTGDIVVFRWPPNPAFDYIKRVIGLPHDTISYHNKVLTINGKVMPQTFVEQTIDESSKKPVSLYKEDLNGVVHDIYVRSDVPAEDFEVTVPEGKYFMMGDNRDFSADSRFWGFVDEQYLRGKAIFVWLSWDADTYRPRWSKMARAIH